MIFESDLKVCGMVCVVRSKCLLGSTLLLVELLEVELEFLALENVAVSTSALAGTRSKTNEETSGLELVGNQGVDDAVQGVLGALVLDMAGDLGDSLVNLLLAELHSVVGVVPLTERSSVNLDDGSLDKGLGAHQLVVGSVVNNIQNTRLAGDGLSTPGVISVVETESALLDGSSTAADFVDALNSKTSVGSLTSHLELSLLAPDL